MHRQRIGFGAGAVALGVGLASPVFGQIVSYPAERLETERRYDSASRDLRVRCISASRGICRVFVADADVQQTVSLRPGASATFKKLSASAKSCTLGRNPTAVCTWERISPVE